MTLHSTGDSSSILENGKLKPGIYKIQNIQSRTYLDVEVHTMEVCCRPAINLEEGRGLVRRYSSYYSGSCLMIQKWEIKSLGAGYSVQFVSVTYRCYRMEYLLTLTKHRLNLGNPNSFVLSSRYRPDSMAPHFPQPLIPWLGMSKSSTTIIAASNTSG